MVQARPKRTHIRTPNYTVAEHTLALLLAVNRCIHKAYARVRENNFSLNGLMGFDVHGKTVGVIGTGQIVKIFCNLLSGFKPQEKKSQWKTGSFFYL